MPLSIFSLNTYKRAEFFVYAADGATFLDKWRFVPYASGWDETINAAIQPLKLTFTFGIGTFDHFDAQGTGGPGTIAQGNVVKIYAVGPGLGTTGTLVYQGVIYGWSLQVDEQGLETITVTLVPQSSVVATNGITSSQAFGTPGSSGTYVDPVSIFNYWFTHNSPYWAHPYTYPLTLDGSNPASSGSTVQYTFQNQDLLSILATTVQLMPANNWFWRANPDLSTTLNQTPTTPQHQFMVGRHCKVVQNSSDYTQLFNVIQVLGDPSLNISATATGSDISTFGPRVKQISDPRIVDSTTAQTLANGLLALLDQVAYRIQVEVVDYRGDSALVGYDIESIKVGQSAQILDPTGFNQEPTEWDNFTWDNADWDYAPSGVLQQIMQIVKIQRKWNTAIISLASFQPSQDRALALVERNLQLYTTGF